jgi:hypothetical protein
MPDEPSISGNCVERGDTAILTLSWSPGFNFSLIYTKNVEGNSYYLNKARLNFTMGDATNGIFPDAQYRGKVALMERHLFGVRFDKN